MDFDIRWLYRLDKKLELLLMIIPLIPAIIIATALFIIDSIIEIARWIFKHVKKEPGNP